MKKVLIINDSGFERMVLRDQVQTLGFEVKTADEFGGLRLIKKFQPDIVIANLTMADISGDQLIEQIKTMQPNTRCLLSTCSRNQRRHLVSQAIDGVLETPATMEHLGKLLNNQEISLGSPQVQETELPAKENNPSNQTGPGSEELITRPSTQEKDVINTAFVFCPYCGKHLENAEPKFIFCPFCGSRL